MTMKAAVIVEDYETIMNIINEKGIDYTDGEAKALLHYACELGSLKVCFSFLLCPPPSSFFLLPLSSVFLLLPPSPFFLPPTLMPLPSTRRA
jgi:hypothetical protein